jgi:hypothetical protein
VGQPARLVSAEVVDSALPLSVGRMSKSVNLGRRARSACATGVWPEGIGGK